jgi:formylglycine-generating enzyme required for sulfatase activity
MILHRRFVRLRRGIFVGALSFLAVGYATGQGWGENLERFVNSLGMEFVLVKPGSFLMGSPENEPYRDSDETLHRVILTRPFYLQTTEVTQAQWRSLMGSNPSHAKKCGGDCPVERVSWYDCQKFLKRLNSLGDGRYRLPTEAEWEYACRAGKSTAYPWGDRIDCTRAMFRNNTRRGTDSCVPYVRSKGLRPDSPAPVKSYPPNPWGIFDMTGNVWEWVEDWYGPYPRSTVRDPKGPPSGSQKVRRGGSWFKFGFYLRCANRNRSHPAVRYRTTGFRVVREYP